jgi:signal transduction histidine kinase
MCSSEGLARFDGYNLRIFGPEHGLPSRVLFDFTPARGGGYWIVTDKGICRLKPGSRIGKPCPLFTNTPRHAFLGGEIHESASGATWLLSGKELLRVDVAGQRIEPLGLQMGEELLSVADGPAGSLLIGSVTGIYQWRAGQKPRRLNGKLGEFGVGAIFPLASGAFWLGTSDGLYGLRFEGTSNQPVWTPDLLKGRRDITNIYRAPSGRLWAVSDKTLFQLAIDPDDTPRLIAEFGRGDGLPDARVHTVAEDSLGTLWGSCDAAGVFRIEESGVSSYYAAEGLGNERIASIFEDRAGTLCVMTSWDGKNDLRAFDGSRFQAIHVPYPVETTGHGWGWNQYGLQATDGEWWFPTSQGLLRYASSTIQTLSTAPLKARYSADSALGCSEIFRTYQDSLGDIWTACLKPRNKLVRWERRSGRFIEYPIGPPGTDTFVLVIRECAPGRIWLGTSIGLFRLNQGRFDPVSTAGAQNPHTFRDLLFDHEGRIWAAGSNYGLLRFDRPEDARPVFSLYTAAEGLSANSVRALAEDRQGYIYACTVRGVDRIDPRAGIGEHRIRRLTAGDGLPDSEPNVAFTDSRGRVWVGTLRGLACIEPARAARLTAPNAFITRLRVRGEDLPIDWNGTSLVSLDLASERNQIEISYAGSDARPVAAVRYQYRLVGANDNWSQPSDQLSVNYPALPSGRLRFEVRGINADGQMSADVAGVDLRVLAPVWQRWWFVTLIAAALSALATALYRNRVRQLLAIANIRTHIATDLHDDIGANLTQIAILSEVAHREGPSQLLEDISSIARDTVAQMSDIVWAVNPGHDQLDSLLHRMRRFAEDTLGGAGIEVTFETTGIEGGASIALEARRPLFLIFKEALNNVVRHSQATRVWAAFELERGAIRLVVDDDGCGFDIHASRDGEGIGSIGRRAAGLGGTAEWTSRPGTGTRLTVKIPTRRGRSFLGVNHR